MKYLNMDKYLVTTMCETKPIIDLHIREDYYFESIGSGTR